MLEYNVLRFTRLARLQRSVEATRYSRRAFHYDGRNRLTNFWTPTQQTPTSKSGQDDGHDLLVRAGFLRQAQSGIFHLLPLGLKVQEKLERLIDKHMLRLGASKVSLSTFSTEELWQRSGRLDKGRSSELFRLEDRKGSKLLLSPTHEEEITNIVANAVHSYKQLPLRLYQISRKYRDEARPRQGLLRGREFLMKDLYTFDVTEESARNTYEQVRQAYCAFLDELKLPYLVADADSGNMGGNLSHEYHFRSDKGEDTIIRCSDCKYSVNEELYIGRPDSSRTRETSTDAKLTFFVSKDRTTLLNVIHSSASDVNIYAVKAVFPEIDPSVEDPVSLWKKSASLKTMSFLFDSCILNREDTTRILEQRGKWKGLGPVDAEVRMIEPRVGDREISLDKAQPGHDCPACRDGRLELHQAVEIGHTFHLGTRYSEPLGLTVTDQDNRQCSISMGCHGIGVSRLIGAVASVLADDKGLSWPLRIAPFAAIVVGMSKASATATVEVYDALSNAGVEVALDDRERPMGWKLNDADLVGYPFIVVLGRAWAERQVVELQCRRLGFKETVELSALPRTIQKLSERL